MGHKATKHHPIGDGLPIQPTDLFRAFRGQKIISLKTRRPASHFSPHAGRFALHSQLPRLANYANQVIG